MTSPSPIMESLTIASPVASPTILCCRKICHIDICGRNKPQSQPHLQLTNPFTRRQCKRRHLELQNAMSKQVLPTMVYDRCFGPLTSFQEFWCSILKGRPSQISQPAYVLGFGEL